MSAFPPGPAISDPLQAALILGVLGGLFLLRVLGQLLVQIAAPRWLPPMEQWYSGLIPYPRLLAIQLVALAAIAAIVAGLAVEAPPLLERRPELGSLLVALAYPYTAAMVVRYVVRMSRRPEQRWVGGTIPIVFHVVLAAFLFVLGGYLRSAPLP